MRHFTDIYQKIVVRLTQIYGFYTVTSVLYLAYMHAKWIEYVKNKIQPWDQ